MVKLHKEDHKKMLKKVIYRLLRHRHFWREVGFDELSELYVSGMFRSLSISLTGLFVPVYLLQLHFSITQILVVVAWYFTFRGTFVDLLAGYTVARVGPKHTMVIGYLILMVSTGLFLTLPQINWPIWLVGGVWGASTSFFYIPFHVDFSKVKHRKHGGKELGFMNIMERIGNTLGPLLGGVLATLFGGQFIFLLAAVLLVVGLIPLFQTAEPIKVNQKLNFRNFNIDHLKRDFISVIALGIENTLSMYLWPLFLGLYVITGNGVYVKLGIITSVSIVVSISSAQLIGKMIDRYQGRRLLRVSAGINAAVHLIRPFVSSLPVALGINMANEAVTPGYKMPYVKGWYDAADDLPGHRIVYITSMEWVGSITKATLYWVLALLTLVVSTRVVLNLGFVIAAIASIVIMSERFSALKPKRKY